jgi:hypothetical protein
MQRPIASPVVRRWIDDDALHRSAGVITLLMRGRAVVARRHDDRTPVRIQEHFAGVEPAALRWIEGAVHAEAVDLTCLQSGDEYVPIVIGTVGDRVQVYDT